MLNNGNSESDWSVNSGMNISRNFGSEPNMDNKPISKDDDYDPYGTPRTMR